MKEVVAEFPLVTGKPQDGVLLFRFLMRLRSRKPAEMRIKPRSGYAEIPVPFPDSNISPLKTKTLNSTAITYRGLAKPVSNYYYAIKASDKILLTKIDQVYLLEPFHHYYYVEKPKEASSIRRAESREELEKRRNSYSYKVAVMEEEEFKCVLFEDHAAGGSTDDGTVRQEAEHQGAKPSLTKNIGEVTKRITECILRTRIVNFRELVEIYEEPTAVGCVLTKMTEPVCGRFVLKNIYYEKSLWEYRSRLLDLFRKNGKSPVGSVSFLGDEKWLVDELAYRDGKTYCLKGYKEEEEFSIERIREKYSVEIEALINGGRMVSSREIFNKTGIDQELLEEILSSDRYLHLANNCYVLNDGSLKARILALFVTSKVLDVSSASPLDSIVEEHASTKEEVLEELKKYCTHRGEKYYLRSFH